MLLVSLFASLSMAVAPPVWEARVCAAGTPEGARCGTVEVLEDRDRPDGRKLRLNVIVLPSLGPIKYPPMYELAGGPGLHATVGAGFYATDGRLWREGRDIVLVDQRGTGGSGALRCPELEQAPPLTRMYPVEAVSRCRVALSANADLSMYGTREAVADLDTVRKALGHTKIDLFGMSYGTMLAQAYMRSHSSRVRAVVLTGAVPVDELIPLHHAANAERAMALLIGDCAREAACAAAFPNLNADWGKFLARLEAGPVTVPMKAGLVTAERGPVLEALRALMTTSTGQKRIPMIIHRGAGGDFAPLGLAVEGGGMSLPEGMYLSVVCPEATNRITDEQATSASIGTFLGEYRVSEQRGACRAWLPGLVKREPPLKTTGHKVLFLVGGRDHVAAPEWAEALSRRLPGSLVVRLEPMSHGVEGVLGVECFDKLGVGFLADERLDEDELACVAEMRAPPFATK